MTFLTHNFITQCVAPQHQHASATKKTHAMRLALSVGLGVALFALPTITNASSAVSDMLQDSSQLNSFNTNVSLAQGNVAQETKQNITQALEKAGIKLPIDTISPSRLPNMYQVTLKTPDDLVAAQLDPQPPLHVTADGRYVLQGELQDNPSPQVSEPPVQANHMTQNGMPVSDALRQSMLKNMSLLKNMGAHTPLYHTAVDDVIWGVATGGAPFITNSRATVFTDGEISVIDDDGQFAGLDTQFEETKNRHIFAQLDERNLVIYPATTSEQAVIYVATDIECPYCRLLHKDISKLNAKGITVKVIGYPIYESSPEAMRQIWCNTNPTAKKQALDAAMAGQAVANTCPNNEVNPLQANRLLADGLAVLATPAIYRDDGVLYEGSFAHPEFFEFLGVR